MIDTIEFVLHSVNKENIDLSAHRGKSYAHQYNRMLYERLLHYENKYVEREHEYLQESEHINPDTKDIFKSQSIKKVGFVTRPFVISDNRQARQLYFRNCRGNFSTPSSDYRVNFSTHEHTDSISFQLSIPKYFYNHNVAQFVPNISSKRYLSNMFFMREFEGQVKYIRERILEFLYTFFDDLSYNLNLPVVKVFDMSCVEIKRLDLCYNQLFPSYEFARDYLDSQKKFKNTRIRSNTIVDKDTDTSLYYRHSTDGFFFKIYLKGDEFLANDFSRLMKENKAYIEENKEKLYPLLSDVFRKHFPDSKRKNTPVTDIMFEYYQNYSKGTEYQGYCRDFEQYLKYKPSFILQEARKILRYEMSFTRTYMSTLYKREVFRKSDTNWKRFKKAHSRIKQYDKYLNAGQRERAENYKRAFRLTQIEREMHNAFDKSLHKKHHFHIVTPETVKHHEKVFTDYKDFAQYRNYKIGESDIATLSDSLLKLIYKKFKEEIDYYQVKQMQEVKSILEAIDDFNKKVDVKVANYIKTFGKPNFQKLKHTEKRKKGYSKLNKTRLKVVLDKMEQGEGVKTIAENMGMSKSAYYTLLDDLKRFDVHKQSIRHKFNYSLVRTDFKPYYDQFYTDTNFHKKFFHKAGLLSLDAMHENIF